MNYMTDNFFTGAKRDGKSNASRKRRLATAGSYMNLPKPQRRDMALGFDSQGGILTLDGKMVRVDRVSKNPSTGYQRDYDDDRARQYGANFNWGLFGTPIVNLRDDDAYWLISGQHRLAAAGYAGHTRVAVAVYEGLTLEQEAWLFNQEAVQRVDLTALDKFHSGVRAGFPDHIAIMEIVDELGGNIALKSTPRIGNVAGITAVDHLLRAYDHVGGDLLKEALMMLHDGFGELRGPAVEGAMIQAMTQFLGIYNKGSQFGYAERDKFLERLQTVAPAKIKRDASKYEGYGTVPARIQAFVDLYNRGRKNRLEWTRPDWRKCGSNFCNVQGCDENGRTRKGDPKPGRAYRRSYCRRHYELAKKGAL